MKTAIYEGAQVTASATSPKQAECPKCGSNVFLCDYKKRAWFYKHPPNRVCSLIRSDLCGYYGLALALVRQTLLDALNGHGMETLDCLFDPVQQAAIGRLFNQARYETEERTRLLILQIKSLSNNERARLRHMITRRCNADDVYEELWK